MSNTPPTATLQVFLSSPSASSAQGQSSVTSTLQPVVCVTQRVALITVKEEKYNVSEHWMCQQTVHNSVLCLTRV